MNAKRKTERKDANQGIYELLEELEKEETMMKMIRSGI